MALLCRAKVLVVLEMPGMYKWCHEGLRGSVVPVAIEDPWVAEGAREVLRALATVLIVELIGIGTVPCESLAGPAVRVLYRDQRVDLPVVVTNSDRRGTEPLVRPQVRDCEARPASGTSVRETRENNCPTQVLTLPKNSSRRSAAGAGGAARRAPGGDVPRSDGTMAACALWL